MAPRETENNSYTKFWGDKGRALWYVMVFSGVVNCKLGMTVRGSMKDALQNKVVLGLSHHPALICPILATSMGTTSFQDIHSLILPSNPNPNTY